MSAATVIDITTKEEMAVEPAPASAAKPTRKAKQEAKKAAEQQKILDEAAKIGNPADVLEKFILAKAALIRNEDKLTKLDEEMAKINQHLGDHKEEKDLDNFVEYFSRDFLDHGYTCAVKNCGAKAEWIFSLKNSLSITATKRGQDSYRVPWNHSEQWKKAVEFFHGAEDIEGLLVCECCRGPLLKMLEEEHPREDSRNHQFYHIKGFVPQLAKNRHQLLREDLAALEQETLEVMEMIENDNKKISLLEEEVKEAEEKKRAMRELISFC